MEINTNEIEENNIEVENITKEELIEQINKLKKKETTEEWRY